MKAVTLRHITRLLPLPGRITRSLLDRWEPRLRYPDGPVVVSSRGWRGLFEIRDYRERIVQRNIYFLGYYEIRETRQVQRCLRPGDVFVDVGAHIGWFTVLGAGLVGEQGVVIAFEPSDTIHAHLRRNVELNRLRNVRLERLAVADRTGTATLRRDAANRAPTASIFRLPDGGSAVEESVQTVRLDEYLATAGIQRVRLLKMDVEGAELRVLKGAQELLSRHLCDYVLFEASDETLRMSGGSCRELMELLTSCGYELFRMGLWALHPLNRGEPVVDGANILARLTQR